MKNITILFFSALMLTLQMAFGQVNISGIVKDSQGQGLPFANVLLLQQTDSALVKGVVTDNSGTFSISEVPAGNYLIVGSMVGYHTIYTAPATVKNNAIRLDDLILTEDVEELSEVVVRSTKPPYEQHLDKLVVNVENSIMAVGGNALDILARSPGVYINQQSNNISLSGKQNVLVMINGKLSPLPLNAILQQLSGMAANNIEKIELISSPSARYDAQGDAGIINIILKKNQELGTNGSYTLTAGYGYFEKGLASLNLNHRTEKVNIFADYSADYNHQWQLFTNQRRLYKEDQTISTDISSEREAVRTVHNARLGMDYTVSPKTTMGILLGGFSNKWDMDANALSDVRYDEILHTHTRLKLHEINHWTNLLGNLNLQHRFNEKNELNIDLDYVYYHDKNPTQYFNTYETVENALSLPEQFYLNKNTPIHMWVAKADLYLSLGEKARMESGLKGTISRMENVVQVQRMFDGQWELDTELSQDYLLMDDLGAAYTSFFTELDAKTKLQLGLRTEYTRMTLHTPEGENIFNRQFLSLFPTVFVSRKAGEHHQYQLSYNRRITRPSYEDIAPFVHFVDPNTYFTGNPSLRPTLSNKIQLGYTFKEAYLFSLSYSHDRHFIANFQSTVNPENNLNYLQSENLDRVHTWSFTAALPFDITSWWLVQNNLVLNHQQIKTFYKGEDLDIGRWTGQLNSIHSFVLPYDFSAELSAFYAAPTQFGIATFGGMGNVGAAIQKSLAGGNTKLSLSIDDIFWTNRWLIKSDMPALHDHQQWELLFEPRVVRLSFSHNFGSQKVKGRRSRSTGSEEERKRVPGS